MKKQQNNNTHTLTDRKIFPKVHRYVCDRSVFNIFSNTTLEIGDIIQINNEKRQIASIADIDGKMNPRIIFSGIGKRTIFYGVVKTVPVDPVKSVML